MEEIFKMTVEGTVSDDGSYLMDDEGNDALGNVEDSVLETFMSSVPGKKVRVTLLVEEMGDRNEKNSA